jgi:putative endonuclease
MNRNYLLTLKLCNKKIEYRHTFFFNQKNCFYVYILLCSCGSYYTGVTNNLVRRFFEHNNSTDISSYTYSRRPLKLVYFQTFKYILNAIAREKQIKKWSRAKKEALITGNYNVLHELSSCKNETSHIHYLKPPSNAA